MLEVTGSPRLLRKLQASARTATISRLAALLTEPHLHANTLRIELLVHLSCVHCHGGKIPTSKNINQWCNEYFAGSLVVSYEDPIEQVMVGNVMTDEGNFRVLNGIWDGNDFYLQEILDAFVNGSSTIRDSHAIRSVLALLTLSDSILDKSGLGRWLRGSGSNHGKLNIPTDTDLAARSELLTINYSQIRELSIDPEDLTPFIADDSYLSCLKNEEVGNSSLERRPLVRVNDETILFALPTAVSIAIRQFLLAVSGEAVETAQEKLVINQSTLIFEELIKALDCTPIEVAGLPPRPAHTPATSEGFFRFDTDKIAHIILLHDDLRSIRLRGINTFAPFTKVTATALEFYLTQCSNYACQTLGATSGITIVILGGIGGPRSFGITQIPSNWRCSLYTLADFYLLTMTEDVSLLRLWKFEGHKEALHEKGLTLMNAAGELNLLGFWKKQNYCFVQKDMAVPGTDCLTIMSDFLIDIHEEVANEQDIHVVRYDPNTFLRVRRLLPHPYFKESRRKPIYGSIDRARDGQLYGVVETSSRAWWLISHEIISGPSGRLIFGLWEALLTWLGKLAPVLDLNMVGLDLNHIHITISVEDIETWPILSGIETSAAEVPVVISAEYGNGFTIAVPKGFRTYLRRADSIGERLLVESIASGVFELISRAIGTAPSFEPSQIARSIVRSEDERHVHFFDALSPGHLVATVGNLGKPRFIQPEDESSCRLGLAFRSDPSVPRATLSGAGLCNPLLEKIVDKLWAEISQELSFIDRPTLVRLALENNEALLKDREHWNNTTRALLATLEDKDDVRLVCHKRDVERIRGSLASRVLVEMAVCGTNQIGRPASYSDYDSLVAKIIALIEFAYWRDALRYNLAPEKLAIRQNGFIEIDKARVDETVSRYNLESFNASFNKAKSDYYSLYEKKKAHHSLSEVYPAEFTSAFFAEYGLTLDKYVEVIAELFDIGIESKQAVVTMNEQHVKNRLKDRRELSEMDCLQFFKNFALQEREKWDEVSPPFSKRDFYPWRYQRRLSLMMRPVVWLENTQPGILIYGLQNLAQSMDYVLANIELGWLQQANAESEEMKAFIGSMSDAKGKDFEFETAAVLKRSGWEVRTRTKLSAIGGPENLGDIDVLAWKSGREDILAIECKRLKTARTVGEVGEQLKEFRGDVTDKLGRHLRRIEWLRSNNQKVHSFLETKSDAVVFKPLLVTSTIVPMQFKSGLPLSSDNILPINLLEHI
jgi:hypothetical protein